MKRIPEYLLLFIILIVFLFNCKNSNAQLINEFSSDPGSGGVDWVEIYTNGVDKSLYQTKDSVGNVKNLSEAVCNGNICTVDWSNRLNKDGDTIKLILISSPDSPVDQITYGGSGYVCVPGEGQSIGRVATLDSPYEPTNVWERFSTPSKGQTNNNGVVLACPSPTPVPSSTPTNAPDPTNTPAPTNTPTSTPKPTSTPTPSPTKKPTPTPKDNTAQNEQLQAASADVSNFRYNPEENEDKKTAQEVLGSSDEGGTQKENISPFAYVLFALGVIFIGVSIFFFVKHKNSKS